MRVRGGCAGALGSTVEMAPRIAGMLPGGGSSVEVRPLELHDLPDAHDAVVLGSTVHHQAR